MDLSVLFSNLVGLFLLIGVGFFAVRARLLPAESSKPMSTLLMKVTVPATIVHSMLRPFDPGFLRLGISIFLVGAVAFPLFSLLSLGLSRLLRVPQDRRGMWCCCATFCNNGFMGFPVALALFGEEGLTLTVILSIPFNLLMYSVGAKMVCMDLPRDGSARPISWSRAVFSVINLSMAVGLLLYFTQLPLPQAILGPLGYLSDPPVYDYHRHEPVPGAYWRRAPGPERLHRRRRPAAPLSCGGLGADGAGPRAGRPGGGGGPHQPVHARPCRRLPLGGGVWRPHPDGRPDRLPVQPAVHRHHPTDIPASVT